MIVIYNSKDGSSPFFSRKIHTLGITKLRYYIEDDLLISSSKD